jgi:hypothetical protein
MTSKFLISKKKESQLTETKNEGSRFFFSTEAVKKSHKIYRAQSTSTDHEHWIFTWSVLDMKNSRDTYKKTYRKKNSCLLVKYHVCMI